MPWCCTTGTLSLAVSTLQLQLCCRRDSAPRICISCRRQQRPAKQVLCEFREDTSQCGAVMCPYKRALYLHPGPACGIGCYPELAPKRSSSLGPRAHHRSPVRLFVPLQCSNPVRVSIVSSDSRPVSCSEIRPAVCQVRCQARVSWMMRSHRRPPECAKRDGELDAEVALAGANPLGLLPLALYCTIQDTRMPWVIT